MRFGKTVPSAAVMVYFHSPPTRRSMRMVLLVKPLGPHHLSMCSGRVQAFQTSDRGAFTARSRVISRSAVALLAVILFSLSRLPGGRVLFLGLQFLQVFLQPIEALLPELAVLLHPVGGILQRCGLQLTRPPLRLLAPRDELGTLQHLQMLADRR